jgi:heme-degrading monooxygenase HmoA
MSNSQLATHVRVVRLKGEAAKIDEAITQWKNEIFPLLKKEPGFRGASLVGNRKTGDGFSVTYWESERAMQNARPQVRPQAQALLDRTGGKIVDEDECEVAVLERIQPAKSGVFIRVTTVETDPAKADEGIANYKQKIVPAIRAQAGARTALLFVNRKTGRTFSGSVWDTEQDLQKSEPAIAALRDEAIKKVGGKSAKVEAFEVYVTEILAPALVAS